MQIFRKFFQVLSVSCLFLCMVLWSFILTGYHGVSEKYQVPQSGALVLSDYIRACPVRRTISVSAASETTEASELRLFGVFPIRTVEISRTQRKNVVPGGIPFGVQMVSDGVIVTAVGGVENGGYVFSPAREAGIKSGDVILSIDGKSMQSAEDVVSAVAKSGGKSLDIVLQRENGRMREVCVRPVADSEEKNYRIGIWVRDSSAGIGTVSFYDPDTGVFGGLGHAVCDADTGCQLSLKSGRILAAGIDGVTPSKSGAPGQLNGHFSGPVSCGVVLKNDETGVFGTLKNVRVCSGTVPVAFKQEVQLGAATLLTTLSGNVPTEYAVRIERISIGEERSTKNMLIRVTDPDLLKAAGGIVQGMSGSPILQNGKLVGAVTHVLIDDPTAGYGIFAENMLETACRAASEAAQAAS